MARAVMSGGPMRLKKMYSSREVAALTGLTARQLQLWDAGGLLSPSIPSHKTDAGGYTERRYTPIELFELLVLADLRRRGFTIQQLHLILRTLQEQFGERLFDATGGGGAVQLLTDGKEIYARTAEGAFFNLLKTPAQPLLVIGNEGLLKDLSSSMRPRRRKKVTPGRSSARSLTKDPDRPDSRNIVSHSVRVLRQRMGKSCRLRRPGGG